MRKLLKVSLIFVAALVTLACVAWLVSRPGGQDEPFAPGAESTSLNPSFQVEVVKPRMARPFFGILPTVLEDKLAGGGELRFDGASRGARVGNVAPDRLELGAEGWELLIETDGEGRITRGTRLVFPILLAEVQRTLSCRPADRPAGYLRAAPRIGTDLLDGSFAVELATCENAATGKVINWPPRPLTARGSFAALSHISSEKK